MNPGTRIKCQNVNLSTFGPLFNDSKCPPVTPSEAPPRGVFRGDIEFQKYFSADKLRDLSPMMPKKGP